MPCIDSKQLSYAVAASSSELKVSFRTTCLLYIMTALQLSPYSRLVTPIGYPGSFDFFLLFILRRHCSKSDFLSKSCKKSLLLFKLQDAVIRLSNQIPSTYTGLCDIELDTVRGDNTHQEFLLLSFYRRSSHSCREILAQYAYSGTKIR